MTPSIVALIPARAGSKRIPGKNTRLLGGKPLIEWTTAAATASGVFRQILVCSDDDAILHEMTVRGYGVRARASAPDDQPDIAWIAPIVKDLQEEAFAILRPTSPFRSALMIRSAWAQFLDHQPIDSLRAVEPVRQHPAKMWTQDPQTKRLTPIMPYTHADGTPWHSSPTQSLKPCVAQSSALDIAWTKTVRETGTISGTRIYGFDAYHDEGFSIDYPGDFEEAERRLAAMTV